MDISIKNKINKKGKDFISMKATTDELQIHGDGVSTCSPATEDREREYRDMAWLDF